MAKLTKLISIFVRARRLVIVSTIALVCVSVYVSYQVTLYTNHRDLLWYLHLIQTSCVILFISNLFISYEYIRGIHTCGIEETIETHSLGKINLYGMSFLVLVALLAIQFLIMTMFPVVIAVSTNSPAVVYSHILSVTVLNTLLPGILACLVGSLLAFGLNRVKAYALIALITFIMLPASDLIPGIANDSYHVNIWPAKAIFSNILPPGLTWTLDYQYGVSNEFYRWNIVAFWIFLLLAFVVPYVMLQKPKIKMVMIAICLVLSVVNLYEYSLESSKIDLTLAPTSVFRTDQVYYRHHEPREEEAQFEISEYNMKLDIDRNLSAKVEMKLNASSDLAEYKFTLYNWYKLSSVKDESGSEMSYERDGDYITVHTDHSVESITMSYSGYSPMFYSNEQGVCLPGCFPYYPWAGFRQIFYATPLQNEDLADFMARVDLPKSDFMVEISGVKNLQTNLDKDDDLLRGNTNALSVMGGLLEEKNAGPYHTVISSIPNPETHMDEAFLDLLQAEISDIERANNLKSHIDLKKYKIFQINETMLNRATYGLAVPFENHIFILPHPDYTRRIAENIVYIINNGPPMTKEEKFMMEGIK